MYVKKYFNSERNHFGHVNTKKASGWRNQAEDNERYNILSGWFSWSNPQLNRSVQHQTKCVSSPHPSVHHTKASVQHIKPSVQHIKSVSVLNWCFFCVVDFFSGELTLFSCETDSFFVVNWHFFRVKLRDFRGRKRAALLRWTYVLNWGGPFSSDDSYDMNSSNWDII